jgi:hypothetical protein
MRTGSSARRTKRVADGAQAAAFQVLETADVVEDLVARGVQEQRVDREVAPHRVLGGGAEFVVLGDQQVVAQALGVRRRAAEGGGLDDVRPVGHVHQPEAPADDAAVGEQALGRARMGRGGHVEVLGPAAQEQIAHATAHQVRLVAMSLQSRDDAQCVLVQRLGGDVARGHDAQRRGVGGVQAAPRRSVGLLARGFPRNHELDYILAAAIHRTRRRPMDAGREWGAVRLVPPGAFEYLP